MKIPMIKLKQIKVPVPPYEIQVRIAKFLNSKKKSIDTLLSLNNRSIELLDLYKKAFINKKVLGKDTFGNKKKSGVAYIGEIPENWNMLKGKYVYKLLSKPIKDDDEVITCFRDGNVTLRKNRREEGFTFSDKEIGYQGIDVGDLIVHGMDGFAGAIGISDSRGKGSPVLNVLETKYNKKYIMYYLRNLAYNDVFASLSTGIRVRSCDLNWNKLKEEIILIPPIEQQNKISKEIEETIISINTIIDSKNETNIILSNYRISMVFEYVTGKKEV